MHTSTCWKRNIALLMTGQGITLFGSMMVHYAIIWHITLKTQSGVMMTLIAIAGALPMFFISPFAGVWADRYNKKHIINIADATIAAVTLIMACLFSLGIDYAGLLIVCFIMRALGQGVQTPAVNALIPDLVPQEQLTRINGISGGIQSVVMFASPVAGGALIAVAPIQILMFIDVITAIIGISILLFFVKVSVRLKAAEKKSGVKQYFTEINQGLKYVKQRSFLKKFIILSALFNIMVAPASVMTPLQVARDWGDGVWNILGGVSFGPEQRLAVFSIAFFVGMKLGGLVMGIWGGFKNKSHTMALSNCLLGFGIVMCGFMGNFWLYLLFVILSGLGLSMFQPPMMATLQTNVDGDYMGRVISVISMISSLSMPFGMIIWGPLGDVVAIDRLLIGTGTVLFVMSLPFMIDRTLLKAGIPVQTIGENKDEC